MSSSSDLDIELVLKKEILKKPSKKERLTEKMKTKNESSKKVSTKEMLHQTLKELNSRNGVSLYAVKKYMTEKYEVDTKKIDYLIKKVIKNWIEDGTVVQTKGVGASGSFKLAPKKNEKPKKESEEILKDSTDKLPKPKIAENKTKKSEAKMREKNNKPATGAAAAMKQTDKKKIKNAKVKEGSTSTEKSKSVMMAKGSQLPAKKMSIKKRKSIGSIIKPPRMKPKNL